MLAFVNKYVFGSAVPIILVFAGIYYTVILRGFHLRRIGVIIASMTRKRDKREGGISPFRALTLALAGTLGVGNIVGVSAAIYLGGFGSIFWMWVSALCAMILKYAEIVLAMNHRRFDNEGRPHGSAMLYIKDFFNSLGLKRLAKYIPALFAVLCIINSVSMGSMIQVNAVASSFRSVFCFSPIVVGIVLSILVLVIISSGSDGISRFTELLVPLMSLGYIILSMAVIFLRREMLGAVFNSIFSSAFSSASAAGGVVGFLLSRALRYGTMRGLVSNEAGCGTAPAAHATSNAASAVEQGFFGIFEVFVDTLVLCTMTAVVVIISYPSVSHLGDNFIMMTISAYGAVLGDFAEYFLAIAVLCFAFATVICWAHYGMESVGYLSNKKASRILFIAIYSLSVVAGAVINSEVIWECADFAIGAMTLINVTVICFMSGEVRISTENYFKTKSR